MIDHFVSGSVADWRQRYEGTFGWIKSGENKSLVFITDITDDRLYYSTKQGTKGWIDVDSDISFEFTQVPTGYFNTREGVVYINRKPEKQYQRGISNNNTLIKKSRGIVGASFEIIEDVYSPSMFTYSPKKDWAFSRFVAKLGNLFYVGPYKVAEEHDDVVTIQENLFKQEILDTIKRSNLKVKVDVV